MKYFMDCNTIEEVKALYKKLALQHHPDRGGNTAIMQMINTEYSYACACIAKGAGFTGAEADENIRLSEAYRKVIEAIIYLPGIVVEVVGNWVWATGNTRPFKTELKAAGMFFAHKKCAWYYHSPEFKTRGNGASLEQIRAKYGSETINSKQKTFRVLED